MGYLPHLVLLIHVHAVHYTGVEEEVVEYEFSCEINKWVFH